MRILFAGPTLAGERLAGLDVRGPAAQGDLASAALEGAAAIGLVDGVFEAVAAVWHKEILFALSRGVRVYGAASMGALRAAECAAFGMIGIGRVYEAYASGGLADDAAVAQLHAPAELGFTAITEALVNVEATFGHLFALGLIGVDERDRLIDRARRIFFKERTYDRILSETHGIADERRDALSALIATHRRDIKLEDALRLVETLLRAPEERAPEPEWQFVESPMWRRLLAGRAAAAPVRAAAAPVRAAPGP